MPQRLGLSRSARRPFFDRPCTSKRASPFAFTGSAAIRSSSMSPTTRTLRQQYLAKNPNGCRCHSATGVAMPWPVEGVETKLG
jgi:hypothetical protein